MGKGICLTVAVLIFCAAGPAATKQVDLDRLPMTAPADNASALEALWSAMEAQADDLWEELRPEIEKERAHHFAPTGPADARWAEGGVDMASLLKRAPGGAASNVLYSDDGEGPLVHALDGAILEQLELGWARVAARDFANADGPVFVSLLAVTPAHLLVSREAMEPVGKGFCPKSRVPAPADHMALHRDAGLPFRDGSKEDGTVEGAAFSNWTVLSRTPTPRLCWIYVEVASGWYESRSFDLQGRPLGHMDRGTKRLRIAPLSELRAMLTAKARPIDISGQGAEIQ